jgi:hypothetical protein
MCKDLLHSLKLDKIELLLNLTIEIIFNYSETNLLVPLINIKPFLISYGAGNKKRFCTLFSNVTSSGEQVIFFLLLFKCLEVDKLKLFQRF